MSEPLDIGMPPSLDIQEGYTLRVTALDPTTGALVSGVTVTTVVLTADRVANFSGGGGGPAGDWLLVPGPGA